MVSATDGADGTRREGNRARAAPRSAWGKGTFYFSWEFGGSRDLISPHPAARAAWFFAFIRFNLRFSSAAVQSPRRGS